MNDKYLDPIPTTRDKNDRRKPKTDSVVNTDFLFTALQQQIDNNTKLVSIIMDLTHKLEQSSATIEVLNETLKLYAKEADA